MKKLDNLNYNFVICGRSGYYAFGYHDIMNLSNVRYFYSYTDGIKSSILKRAIRFNFSKKINKYIDTPLSFYVHPRIYPHNFTSDKPICYVFFASGINVIRKSFFKYLRKKYPNVKLVLYYQDLVKTTPQLDINLCKGIFDLIISYDKGDCETYDLCYHPTPMSYVPVKEDNSLDPSDIYFCGKAKTRYPIINKLYQKYSALGLKCDFHLMEYPDDAERIDGIWYNEPLFSYEKNIQHILNTHCVLEIMQEGATGYTPRQWEAIVYNKHLLTNNTEFDKSKYYNRANMHYTSSDDILSWIDSDALYSTEEKEILSPRHLLTYINSLLIKK